MLQCTPTRRIARCGERELLRSDGSTARVDGNWGKASTAQKERRSSTSGSQSSCREKSACLNLSRFRRNAYTGSKENLLKLSTTKANKITLGCNLQPLHVRNMHICIVVRHTDWHNIFFIFKSTIFHFYFEIRVYLSIKACFRQTCSPLNLICIV